MQGAFTPGLLEPAHSRRLRWLLNLSLVGVVFTAVVVLIGAWTRLVDAGLGCPDWPGCYGALVVPDAERAMAHSPGAPLETFKAWMEMIHRYVASTLGLLVITLLALGAGLRRRSGYPWAINLALLGVILVQGAFGAFTVTLKLWPQVVTLHLLGGLTVLLLFLWLHLSLRRFAKGAAPGAPRRRLTPLWGLAMLLLVLQLALGGWVSSNYAGIACQGFPTCNGQWWPEMDWSEGFHLTQTVGPNYLYGQLHAEARTAIHLGHRLGALLLGLALLALALRHWGEARMRPWLAGLVAAYAVQLGLGVANVLMWLPLWLALLHTAGAVSLVLLLTLAVWSWRETAVEAVGSTGKDKEWANV
ncbi:COX15/CtaA family protein [Billgrantia antri]|uniref:COX15/CtaA family protein n=1 Tax=Billgrantia antri TaxID=2846777 RepID=A0ABS6ZPG3_9GAMM|nr:COX15/CtaA family protein [Halomonas antri]MBW6391957.1 COX15/CtaA family protein [Halomonas antri]